MATWDIRQEFQTRFFTIMFCLYSFSKTSKIIQTFLFSEIVRPKMGLIDPSPLRKQGGMVLTIYHGRCRQASGE